MDIIISKPSDTLIQKARTVIVEKDAVILAEAKQAKTDFLVTLDQKHFLQEPAMKFLHPKKIVTPKMLIETLSRLKSTVINKPA
jgi:predicted nucleic acid-binding protein